jgi:serine/threonine protein kinase
MTAEQWRIALRIYSTAQEIALEERRAFIDSATVDPEVVQEVRNLLEAAMEADTGPRSTATVADRTGTQIGRYEIGKLLGRGGMGEVYAARDTELDRPVALKFLLSEADGDRSGIRRFVREAKAASALSHPNILTVYEVVHAESGLAIAMELVEGRALRDLRGRRLGTEPVMDLGRQIASALATAHEKGLVHREIKPENLVLRQDGLVKVLDFGLARGFPTQAKAETQTTGSDTAAGTPRYMSPAQLRGEALTGATDVFSLGVVLYELATGKHPFEAEYAWETAYAIHSREPASPASVNDAISPALEALILAMLTKDPNARPSAWRWRTYSKRRSGIQETTERMIPWSTRVPSDPHGADEGIVSRARTGVGHSRQKRGLEHWWSLWQD